MGPHRNQKSTFFYIFTKNPPFLGFQFIIEVLQIKNLGFSINSFNWNFVYSWKNYLKITLNQISICKQKRQFDENFYNWPKCPKKIRHSAGNGRHFAGRGDQILTANLPGPPFMNPPFAGIYVDKSCKYIALILTS